jgi:hypothetical protein
MTMDKDFQPGNWWATVSGAGTSDAAVETWADDYTRHRSGALPYNSPDDIIGKQDYYKYSLATDDPATVSGQDGKILR